MPYPSKTVVSTSHVVRFVKPSIRYAFEHGDGTALSIDSSDYQHYYEGKETLFWWHPLFINFEDEEFGPGSTVLSSFHYQNVIELKKMNAFLNEAYTMKLITLVPFLTEEDEGKYFVQIEDRFLYKDLARKFFSQ